MKIGLITDVHESSAVLEGVLKILLSKGAERLYFLGDLCAIGENLEATSKLLVDHDVIGVWGNHDLGLCEMDRETVAESYGFHTAEYVSRLRPSLLFNRIYMAHIEPWLDPEKIEDLWYMDGLPVSDAQRERLFLSDDWDIAFAGHVHRWFHASVGKASEWQGESELDLSQGRHFVIISACYRGDAAIFDTESRLLTPVRCVDAEELSKRSYQYPNDYE